METKFIGLNGYDKIKSLSARRRPEKINTPKKVIRFIKRLAKFTVKQVKIRFNSRKAVAAVQKKAKTEKPKNISVLDRCYNADRRGNVEDFDVSVKKLISDVKFENGRKYAHCAPSSTGKVQKIIKNKAMLACVSCLVAVMLSCLTVANALDTTAAAQTSQSKSVTAEKIAEKNTGTESIAYEAIGTDNNNNMLVATGDEVFNPLISTYALYVDGEMIGATADRNALCDALAKVLADYRADYDDETTTEFANCVEIVAGNYSSSQIMTVEEIIEAAMDKFSISLSTDILYTVDVDYDTEYEYDDTQDVSYRETVTDGADGEAVVTLRTTFVDGVQTDCVVTAYEITREPVNEVIITGSNEEIVSYSSSGSFGWPVPYTYSITSGYGYRWGAMHTGIDISDSGIYGQEIVASDAGTVEWAGYDDSGYGNYVIIDHSNGYKTLYGHCSAVAVSAGEQVSKGETIAYVGSTGDSTGPHLHFEIRACDERLDPMQFL